MNLERQICISYKTCVDYIWGIHIKMVGERCLTDLLAEKQILQVLKKSGNEGWEVVRSDLRPAADGLTGFLGDHLRVTLYVTREDCGREVHLFVKALPRDNKQKSVFIDEGNYFRREMVTFEVFEELGGDEGPNPWRTKAYVYSESILVMPDLAKEGYSHRPYTETLDLPHFRLVAASMARFHAAYANHATRKTSNAHRPYNFLLEYGHVMEDPTFKDSQWLHAAAKLSSNLVNIFSDRYKNRISDLEEKLCKLYIEACADLRNYDETLNVLLHKDLWSNNIMFKYEEGIPTNSLLIDFQCLRYGPPAFDLMILLYLNTSRSFRDEHEKEICLYYYSIFTESLDVSTELRLKGLGYDLDSFLGWCERARAFGLFEAVAIFPYVLMDPLTAARVYDDPDTYMEYMNEDRTRPVAEYCRLHRTFKERQMEVTEEFIERYVPKTL